MVETEAWARLSEKRGMDVMSRVSASVPLGGAAMVPTDIGDVVSFLAQPGLGGRFITGQSIPVDAGLGVRTSF